MLVIVTALPCEAAPIVRALGLEPDPSWKPLRVFSCRNGADSILLGVSGIGKTRAASLTAALLTAARKDGEACALNIGLCGAPLSVPLGSLRLVNSITDEASGRTFFPDMLLRSSIEEASLTCCDRPKRECDGCQTLADMESSGFFEAAAMFLPPSRIFCAKIVSDAFRPEDVDRSSGAALIERNLSAIEELVAAAHLLARRADADRFSAPFETLLGDVSAALSLTVTQRHELRALTRGFYRRHSAEPGEVLRAFSAPAVTTKQESRERFSRLSAALAA